MRLRRDLFDPIRQEWIELLNQVPLEIPVIYQLGNRQRAIPGANFGIDNILSFALFDFKLASKKILGHAFADLPG